MSIARGWLGSTKRSPVWVPCLIKHGNVGEVIRLPDLSCVETKMVISSGRDPSSIRYGSGDGSVMNNIVKRFIEGRYSRWYICLATDT